MDPYLAAMRFGYGPLAGDPGPAPDRQLAQDGPVSHPAPAPARSAERMREIAQYRKLRRAEKGGNATAGSRARRLRRKLRDQITEDFRADLMRAAFSPAPLNERLVRFWADHFTVAPRNLATRYLNAAFHDEAIRPNLKGRFADLLIAAATHPAMLIYLDQARSFGPNSRIGRRRGRGLNENLAREILELHTLGVGAGYSQRDVREFAELLTGLALDRNGVFRFVPGMAEPGAETVLGRAYGGGPPRLADITAALTDLAARPETARHIARKLAVHFVADDPPAALVEDLARVYRTTGGDLPALHAALVAHPDARRPALAKVRQPFDLVVATLRALGTGPGRLAAIPAPALWRKANGTLTAMGQPWRAPRGPDGWPEAAAAWITPPALAARIEWAMAAPRWLAEAPPADPTAFARATLGPYLATGTAWAVARAESRWEAVGLVLAAPEFNRR